MSRFMIIHYGHEIKVLIWLKAVEFSFFLLTKLIGLFTQINQNNKEKEYDTLTIVF